MKKMKEMKEMKEVKEVKEMKLRYAMTTYAILPSGKMHEGGVRGGNSTANGQ